MRESQMEWDMQSEMKATVQGVAFDFSKIM